MGHCFADDCRKTDDDLNDLFKHVKRYKPYQLVYSLCLILCLPLAIRDAHGTRRTRFVQRMRISICILHLSTRAGEKVKLMQI
jgi:hypothetical protein